MPMQTDDNGTRPALDGLDAFFAAVLQDERNEPNLELANPCCASRGEMLPMPVVIEDDLLAGLEE